MTSKRVQIAALKQEIRDLNGQKDFIKSELSYARDQLSYERDVARDANQVVDDLLLLLGKKRKHLPELRQAASAIRYADEHEKQMAVAKDWTL